MQATRWLLGAALLAGALALSACAGLGSQTRAPSSGLAPVAEAGPAVIQVRMGEFYFKPEVVRVKAGQEVRIDFVNDGKIVHEFMAGREVEMHEGKAETFEKDFFKGMDVKQMGQHMESGSMKGMEAADHGMEVELQGGERASLSFTVPTDRNGEWEIGCFVPGHYEAGMKGKLIVE